MSTNIVSLNSGPLAWVHPEIELALGEVERVLHLREWPDAATRIGIQAHLHQISGALHMVELPAPQRLAEELEAVFRAAGESFDDTQRSACALAIETLRGDLRSRLNGESVRDLDALPALQALGELRGLHYGEVELFFPDLAAFPAGNSHNTEQAAMARNARADFQRNLVGALRAPRDRLLLTAMSAVLQRISALAPGRFGQARWEVVAELLAALPGLPDDGADEVRRFFRRIDRQLAANSRSDDSANEALLRETLHVANRIEHPGAQLQSFLRAARVAELLAPQPSVRSLAVAEPPQPAYAALLAALRRAEELLEAWFREQAEVELPEGVKLMSLPDIIVATCRVLAEAKTTEQIEAETPIAPEVIRERAPTAEEGEAAQ